MDVSKKDGLSYITGAILFFLVAVFIGVKLGVIPIETPIIGIQWCLMVILFIVAIIFLIIGCLKLFNRDIDEIS